MKGRGRSGSGPPPVTPDVSSPRYEASSKHCEPIAAQRPGTKCPAWSAAMAQALLDGSEPMGQKLVATARGIAFVAQLTYPGERNLWHGYPEAWDKISVEIKNRWLSEKRITKRDLRRWNTREAVQSAWTEDQKC
jgi:hypothetical protein